VPSAQWGEEVKAIIVPAPDIQFDANAVLTFARKRLAGYKTPKSINLVAELPRNAGGKVLRRLLRAPFWQGSRKHVG
jgi:fatty-acyl-CoA synthase